MNFAFRTLLIVVPVVLGSCNQKSREITTEVRPDSASIAAGMAIFNQDCSACHNFVAEGIGPALGGITTTADPTWIKKFIANPKASIDAGDERASKLFQRFRSVMPSFPQYSPDKLDNIVAYLSTKKKFDKNAVEVDPNALTNPIADTIRFTNLVADLQLVMQFPYSSDENPRARIVKLDTEPGTDRLFMLDLRGRLYYINNGTAEVYFDISNVRKDFIPKPGLATGFGSFAFHPDFNKNGLMYTSHTEPPRIRAADFNYHDTIPSTLQWVVTEWRTTKPEMRPFQTAESRELLRIDMVTGLHGMQELAFNPYAKRGDQDYGLLYIGIGDGGAVENRYPFLVQSTTLPWGTILRIDPLGRNSKNGRYGIPATNPFVNKPGTRGEIYAYGFRNPHKLTWLRNGKMLASNIGHTHIESFNLVEPGRNYGWPLREGTFVHLEAGNMNSIYPLPDDDAKMNFTYPVIQYDHTEGNSVSSGYEYTGSAVPAFKGKFLFGDIMKGRLFYSDVKEIIQGNQAPLYEWKVRVDGKETTMEAVTGNPRVDLRLGRDSKGEIYVYTKPDGKLYKVISAHQK